MTLVPVSVARSGFLMWCGSKIKPGKCTREHKNRVLWSLMSSAEPFRASGRVKVWKGKSWEGIETGGL